MLVKWVFPLLACGFLTMSAFAADTNIKLDKEESKIEFVGKKADGKHEGGFKEFTVDATVNQDEPTKGSIKIVITADSLYSDDPKLTNHLKNPDFFDVQKHKTITFQSKSVEIVDDGHAKIKGVLSMLGKEEELVVPVTVTADEEEIELVADFKLDRTKWGMNFGVGNIEKEVEIKATLLFDL